MERGLEILRSWGLQPAMGRHLYCRLGYLAGSDAQRLSDLQNAIGDPAVRAVIAARGGYGVQRIVDRLDLGPLRNDPKPIIGFSDLTALHLAVHRRAGVITFHGPGAAWDDERLDATSVDGLHRLLFSGEPPGRMEAPGSLIGGDATGVLLGGNLAMLAASIGTPDEPDLRGAIVLLEDVGEPAYRLDRMLTHLERARALDAVDGFVLGDTEVVGVGPSFAEIAVERLGGIGVPIVGPLPVGHGPGQLTLPLGAIARLEGSALVIDATVTAD